MPSQSVTFGGAVVGLLIGVVVLLFGFLQGAEEGVNALILGGGILAIVSVSWMAWGISALEAPGDAH